MPADEAFLEDELRGVDAAALRGAQGKDHRACAVEFSALLVLALVLALILWR